MAIGQWTLAEEWLWCSLELRILPEAVDLLATAALGQMSAGWL